MEAQKMSNKIFVGNIPYCSTGHNLWEFFSKFGRVVDALVVRDKRTRKSKGFGFVRFSKEDEAERALKANTDELTMKGRVLNTGGSESKKPRDLFGGIKVGCTSKTTRPDRKNKDIINGQNHNDTTPKDDDACIKTKFVDLNDDVRDLIFSHLSLIDLCRISRVSKQWRAIITSVWKQKKTLYFSGFTLTLSDKILSRILAKTQKGLTNLNLRENSSRLSYFALEMVGELCPNLKRVDISGMVVTKPSLKKFSQFCPNVEVLVAVNCERFNAKSAWELLHSLDKLKVLDLSKNERLTGKCFERAPATITRLNLTDCEALLPAGVAFAIQYCPSLSNLSLGGCSSLDATVLPTLLLSKLTSLQMNGRYPRITNSSEFAEIGKIPTLKSLNVSYNDMVCDDLLANLSSVESLIFLNVSGCNGRIRNNSGVTDAGLRNLENIVHLDISYLSGVSDRAIRRLSTVKSLKTVQMCGNSLFRGSLLAHRSALKEHLDVILGGTEGLEWEADRINRVNIGNVTIHLFNNCIGKLRPDYWNNIPDQFDSDSSDSSDADSEHEYGGVGEIYDAISSTPKAISDNIMQPFQSDLKKADNENATETAEYINNHRGQNFEDSCINETAGAGEVFEDIQNDLIEPRHPWEEAEADHDNEMDASPLQEET